MKKSYNTIKTFRLFTSKFINTNFRIKLYGMVEGVMKNTLLGVTGALSLMGEKLYIFIERAILHGKDKEVCMYKGAKVTLYSK